MSPTAVSAKSAKLDTPQQSARISLCSHEDLGVMTGMDYRSHQSTSEHPYCNDQPSTSSGMAVGGLVRSNNGQYPSHYSHMPSSAPPDQGYDDTQYSSNQHVPYHSIGLPPLVDKNRSKTDEYNQENGEDGLDGDSRSLYVGKSSNLRNSGSYVSSMISSSPADIGSKNDSQTASSSAYNQALPPMGTQPSAFYLFPGGANANMPSKEIQGYENAGMNTSKSSGTSAIPY